MLMKSSSSISTTFYDITCKGFQYDLTSYFENFEKKRSLQLLQVSLKTKATYSKAKVQKKFIGIFGIQNQEHYYSIEYSSKSSNGAASISTSSTSTSIVETAPRGRNSRISTKLQLRNFHMLHSEILGS